MKDKVLRRQWLPTRPSGIKHVCSNTITQCYEEQRRDSSQAAQHLVVLTMSQASASRTHCSEATTSDTSCFFCGKSGTETLHEVATFQVDTRVRKCAAQVGDNELMARLSMGDMVALEAKYHSKCLLALYYRAKTTVEAEQKTDHEGVMSRIVLAELVLYIEETPLEEGTAPVFRLADLAKLYTTRMEQLGVALCKKVNSTRLKERLLAQLPGLRSQSKGQDVLLAFDEDIGEALGKACEQDCDTEAVHLARAAQIVRRYMFEDTGRFRGSFQGGCQEDSVPNVLVAMVNMVLDGPSIKNQSHSSSTQAALSIAQLLKFNSVKQSQKQGATKTQEPPSVRHSSSEETPLPTYVGLMLHAETRKRGLVDKLFSLGLSISYDRVLRLSAQMGNSVCQLYRIEQVVCPPTLRSNVFTTAAVDNIDHNPSATTAKNSFHGTGISLVQHPTCAEEGVDRSIALTGSDTGSKTVEPLPEYYTDVRPVASSVKGQTIPATSVTSLRRHNFEQHIEYEYMWLENTRSVLKDDVEACENTSWAAYHARHQDPKQPVITPTSLLPLFQESAHTVAMIRHSIDVVRNAVQHLNPGQTPVLTCDQPLFTLAKQIQWKWPDTYGEDQLVVMFGGLHIEMTALKTLGDWLQGSGWTQALVQGNLEEFFRHENQQCPPALSDGGRLYLGSKSDLLVCLEGHAEPQSEAPTVTAVVLDGAVIVQMLKPGTANTFEEYAQQVFIPYVVQQLQHVSRLDLVWDSYRADSLKASTREHRGKGVRRRVVDSAVIPGNWQSFLRVDGNKVELFSYLSTMLAESFQEEGKELVVTDGEQVICVPQ